MYNDKNRGDVNVKRNTRNFSTKLEKSLGSTESRELKFQFKHHCLPTRVQNSSVSRTLFSIPPFQIHRTYNVPSCTSPTFPPPLLSSRRNSSRRIFNSSVNFTTKSDSYINALFINYRGATISGPLVTEEISLGTMCRKCRVNTPFIN